jgi:hypothetical protein
LRRRDRAAFKCVSRWPINRCSINRLEREGMLELILRHLRAARNVTALGLFVELSPCLAIATASTMPHRSLSFGSGLSCLAPALVSLGLAQVRAVLLWALLVRSTCLAESDGDRLLGFLTFGPVPRMRSSPCLYSCMTRSTVSCCSFD